MKTLALIVGAMTLSVSALAAGIDSRIYSCAQLQSLIRAKGYVFISQPAFGDFVVANASICGLDAYVQSRGVPTTDNPSCDVNYCVPRGGGGGGN